MRRLTLLMLFAVLLPVGWAGTAGAAPPRPPGPSRTPVPLPPVGRAPDGSVVGGPLLERRGVIVPAGAPRLPAKLSPRAFVLADLDSGDVLAARDPHGKFLPASTLKLLTALTLIPRLDRRRVVVATAADCSIEGSRVGLVPKGKYSVELLFQALLMSSGNDAASALARTAGGVPETLALMNEQARRLGAYDTRAATPSGLEGPGQSTSAYDLALIARAAFGLPDFRRWDAQRRGKVPAQKPKWKAFEFANQNRLLYFYRGAIGGKTGFTDAARHTYVGAARREGRRLVVTFLHGEPAPAALWMQAGALLDWGFALPRGTVPVGTLVGPADAPATAGPAATPSPAPSTGPAAGSASSDPGRVPPLLLLAAGVAGAGLLAAGAGTTLRRRRRTVAARFRQPRPPWA